jgi:hypothetical protein
MTRILLVGYDPETVDFSDPALPPGMTAEKVRAGIAVALKQFAERGWEADVGFIRPDETTGPTVERQLASTTYDCVVIGAGVRLPPRRLALFEAVINAVHKAAPGAAIAFNTRPEDSADAAARWLPVGSRAVKPDTQQDETTASGKPRPWARLIPREIPLLWPRKVDREIIQVTSTVVIVVINAVAWLLAVKVRSVVRWPEGSGAA